ncbi:hypothetical protein EGK14_01165 [Erwinia sp. 198]|nr:hypothetical protein EGK14_01165 [Erwinia sp. 198]
MLPAAMNRISSIMLCTGHSKRQKRAIGGWGFRFFFRERAEAVAVTDACISGGRICQYAVSRI